MAYNWLKYKKWWMLLITIIIIVILAFAFRVEKFTVEGNTFFTEKQLKDKFQNNILENNTITFWIMDLFNLTPKLEFVNDYEVTYPSINEIHVKLNEKKIVAGIVYTNEYIYFDRDAIVLKSTSSPIEGIPLFESKSVTTFSLYSKVSMKDEELLSQIINLANLFNTNSVKWDKVVFNDKKEATLYAGNITVLLGHKEKYDESISALASVLEKARERKLSGQIDLTNYTVKSDVILKQNKPINSKQKKDNKQDDVKNVN